MGKEKKGMKQEKREENMWRKQKASVAAIGGSGKGKEKIIRRDIKGIAYKALRGVRKFWK